jgi:Family of unknown function (DUF6510)
MADSVATTLDGHAIAGLLADVFGEEMTTVPGTCSWCGLSGVATFVAYARTPGTVARCPGCASVFMVFVTTRQITCVDLRGLVALERAR